MCYFGNNHIDLFVDGIVTLDLYIKYLNKCE